MVNNKNIYRIVLLLFGIFAPMPIITVFSFTMYVWFISLLTVMILIDCINKGSFKIFKSHDPAFILVIVSWFISYFICLIKMPLEWQNGLITGFIQICFLLIICIFFFNNDKINYLLFYIKGVYISSIVQMVWGYAQLVFDKIGLDLNSIVFNNFLHMIDEYGTQYQFGRLKISGLCWNAGNFAPLITFGYIYSKNKYLKLLFIVLGIISRSRTLMIGLMVCVLIEILTNVNLKIKITRKKVFFSIITIFLLFFICMLNFNIIKEKFLELRDLLDLKTRIYTEGSANTHLFYITSIPTITMHNSILSNLFGYGPGCSGYPYSALFDFYNQFELGKWSVESDYINQLWSYGYIGFLVYYFWYIKNMLKTFSIDKKYIILFISFLIEGVMYNITFNWVLFLIIAIFILSKKNINIFKN